MAYVDKIQNKAGTTYDIQDARMTEIESTDVGKFAKVASTTNGYEIVYDNVDVSGAISTHNSDTSSHGGHFTDTNNPHNVTAEQLGLSQALKFIGISTTEITDQGTEDPTIPGYTGTAKTVGHVVIYSGNEFVWANSVWNKLGDDSSYMPKVSGATVGAMAVFTSAGTVAEGTKPQSVSCTLTAAGWSSGVQTVSVSGVTANTVGTFGLATTATSTQYEAASGAQLLVTGQAAGTITVTAFGDTPTVDIPCVMNILY